MAVSGEPDPQNEEIWRAVLTGKRPGLARKRWLFGLLPRADSSRCKACNVPLTGPSAPLMRLLGIRPWNKNPRWCNACDEFVRAHPGGAEVEATLVFADVRGSTGLAEGMSAAAFRGLMQRFYAIATRVFVRTDAIVDKFVGDEAVAIYVPGFAGADCTRRAVAAAQELLAETGHGGGAPWLPVGIGIHSGPAYVGSIGSGEGVVDFTALGDTVNVAARLASAAGAGEILVSETAMRAAALARPGTERRQLALRGHALPVAVDVLACDTPLTRAAAPAGGDAAPRTPA